MTRKLLALDIGEVCVKLQPEVALRAIGLKSYDDMPPRIFELIEELECGRLAVRDFFSAAAVLLPSATEEKAAQWFDLILASEMPGMADAVAGLGPEWNFAFLSDISRPHLENISRSLSFFDQAAGGVYSFEVGRRKPDRAMFKAFEKQFGRPDLYIDDRACNIAAAVDFGWNAVRFTSVAEFIALFNQATR